jgi:hypothetical protein
MSSLEELPWYILRERGFGRTVNPMNFLDPGPMCLVAVVLTLYIGLGKERDEGVDYIWMVSLSRLEGTNYPSVIVSTIQKQVHYEKC